MQYKLLIVEDNANMREILCDYFAAKGFAVFAAQDGAQALEMLAAARCDLALLDIMMPRADGFAVCRAIREGSNMPVIFLTARSREDDMLLGYALGADDYITKPFSLPVLHAKIRSLLGRTGGSAKTLQCGRICADSRARSVTVDGTAITLAPREFDLLLYLMENRAIALSRDRILDAVWGMDFYGDSRAVDTHIKKLRAALGDCAGYIHTVMKIGYKFEVV